MNVSGGPCTYRTDPGMTDQIKAEEDRGLMTPNTKLTVMQQRGCRAHSAARSWDPQPRKRLLGRTPNFAEQHPVVRGQDHPPTLYLRKPRMVTVGKVQPPATFHRSDRDQSRRIQGPTLVNHLPVPKVVFHVQFVDLIENSAFGGHGQTLQSEPRIRISGSTSTLASQSDFFALIGKVRYALYCGSSTSGGGMLPRSQ